MRKIYVVFMILALFFLTTCGYDSGSQPGTGALAFSVDWQGAPNLLAAAPGVFRAPLDCAAAGVATVEAELHDASDLNINCLGGACATGPWDCSAHTGTITGIPPGAGIKIGITGKDANGNVLYFGESAAVDIQEGQTTDVGVITATQIVTLASTTKNPVAVAVDGTSVYWIENGATTLSGAVKKTLLSGGTVTTLASGISDLRSIAVDSTSVYWVEGVGGSQSIKKVLTSGGTVTILAGPVLNNPQSLTIDSANIYFVAGSSSGPGNAIYKIGLNGGPATPIASGLIGSVSNIAVDSTNVYWALGSTGISSIMSAPISGATPTNQTVLVPNLSGVQAIAIDGTSVYWTDASTSVNTRSVKKIAKTGGTVTTLTTGVGFPLPALVVDSATVYWPANVDGTHVVLNSVGVNGGAVRRIAPTDIQQVSSNAVGIAVDSTSIYWPEFIKGTIRKTVK
jgi:hypothetical protein